MTKKERNERWAWLSPMAQRVLDQTAEYGGLGTPVTARAIADDLDATFEAVEAAFAELISRGFVESAKP